MAIRPYKSFLGWKAESCHDTLGEGRDLQALIRVKDGCLGLGAIDDAPARMVLVLAVSDLSWKAIPQESSRTEAVPGFPNIIMAARMGESCSVSLGMREHGGVGDEDTTFANADAPEDPDAGLGVGGSDRLRHGQLDEGKDSGAVIGRRMRASAAWRGAFEGVPR